MSRRKKSNDLICSGCGQEIHEEHLMLYQHREGGGFDMYHSECLHGIKRDKKKTKDS